MPTWQTSGACRLIWTNNAQSNTGNHMWYRLSKIMASLVTSSRLLSDLRNSWACRSCAIIFSDQASLKRSNRITEVETRKATQNKCQVLVIRTRCTVCTVKYEMSNFRTFWKPALLLTRKGLPSPNPKNLFPSRPSTLSWAHLEHQVMASGKYVSFLEVTGAGSLVYAWVQRPIISWCPLNSKNNNLYMWKESKTLTVWYDGSIIGKYSVGRDRSEPRRFFRWLNAIGGLLLWSWKFYK